jgi:hypothetical protein
MVRLHLFRVIFKKSIIIINIIFKGYILYKFSETAQNGRKLAVLSL